MTKKKSSHNLVWMDLEMSGLYPEKDVILEIATIVTNAEGDTIRERIVINNVREVTSETERHEREVIMHRLETIDSTLTAMRSQMQHTDSLVANKETLVEVPAKLTYWQRLRMQTGDIALIAVAMLLGYGIFKLYRRIKP